MSRIVLPSKQINEVKNYLFDFTSQLATTTTISTANATVYTYQGVDSNPSALVSGSASISGQQVNQKLKSGVVGVTYCVVMTITTSDGQTLIMQGYVTVLPATA